MTGAEPHTSAVAAHNDANIDAPHNNAASIDAALMRAALSLALLGPAVDPNPRVGCVIVSADGDIVGQGCHRGAGTQHAEVDALTQAGEAARGGTAYVSLEPCSHTGRTGPCTRALLATGVARVVFAQVDPSPEARGGSKILRDAGVAVQAGLLAAEAEALNPDWTFAARTGRPRVVWKYAATLDGHSAADDGTSQWITSDAARADVHDQRDRCGAIIVGTGTALADDPRLTTRFPDGTLRPRQPLRVVVGRRRDLPANARVLDDSAETVRVRDHDPTATLATLQARGVRRVWLEGGPTLAAAYLRAGLVDEVVAYLAPSFLGSGLRAVGDLGVDTLAGRVRLQVTDVRLIGGDVRITAVPVSTESTEGA